MTLPALHHLPAEGDTTLLFVLCHGDGATPAQMAPLADALVAAFPQAAVLLPEGPLPLASEVVAGQRWFDAEQGLEGLNATLPAFVAQVRAWAQHFGLDWPRVALAGFSQGGTLALHAVMTEPQLAGRVLSFGAAPLHRPQHAPEGVSLHLLHGLADTEVPAQHVVDAARTWVDLEADITADVLPKVGHTLDPQLIERGLHQLRTFIPARLWREATLQALEMERADQAALAAAQGPLQRH
jgi:phospholipase/carboxylesterase